MAVRPDLPAGLDEILGSRDVVAVYGADARGYLQSQLSQDIADLALEERRWTFILTPNGRVECFARITCVAPDRFELDTDVGYADALAERINRFKIRVDVTVEVTGRGIENYDDKKRIKIGWPRLGVELIPGETIPASTGLAAVAVSFTKGCYPGQELVERMDSRAASAPTSLRRLEVEAGTAVGDGIIDDGKSVGTITSVADGMALGWVKRSSDVGTAVGFG